MNKFRRAVALTCGILALTAAVAAAGITPIIPVIAPAFCQRPISTEMWACDGLCPMGSSCARAQGVRNFEVDGERITQTVYSCSCLTPVGTGEG